MRVRYGKPIKSKTILLNCDFSNGLTSWTSYHCSSILSGIVDKITTTTDTFCTLYQDYANLVLGHKYFYFIRARLTSNLVSGQYFYLINNGSSPTTTVKQVNPIKDTWYDLYFVVNSTATSVRFEPRFYTQGVVSNIEFTLPMIIDLTESMIDNLTAEEFYNKYHQYFPLIATGEEITIDDKAGQLPISRLPLEYQEVDYIESAGSQYINTGISISSTDTSFMSKLKFSVSSFTDGDQVILGNTYQDNSMYWLPQFGGTKLRMFSRGNGSGNIVYGSNLITNTIYNINSYTSQTLQKLVVDDNVYSKTNNLAMMDSQNLYLFANNYKNNTITAYIAIKLYKAQLYKSEQLVRDFIPCYRKSDNVIGLYDLVGKQFYTNQGTGAFLKGPNVNNTISCKIAGGSSDIYYGYNQLCENGDFSNSKSSWTDWNSTTVVTNGVAEITRTNTSQSSLYQGISANPGDKIYVRATMWSDGTTPVRLGLNGGISWSGTATTSTTPVLFEVIKPVVSTGNGCRIELFGTGVANTKYYAKEINAINLTTWFGAGKEPSTVEEFKEKFTKDYYGFCSTPIKLTQYQIEALPTYGYNQLGPLWATDTSNGVTTTIKNDGKDIELSGTATGWYTKDKNLGQTIPSGHKVLVMSEMTNPTGANFGYRLRYNSDTPIYANKEFNKIHTLTGDINKFQLYADLDDNCTGIKLNNLVIIDLTDWYGAGNEPTTVEEFKATFPNKYYPYSKKTLLNKYMINGLGNN